MGAGGAYHCATWGVRLKTNQAYTLKGIDYCRECRLALLSSSLDDDAPAVMRR
jgi:hypothetical protein